MLATTAKAILCILTISIVASAVRPPPGCHTSGEQCAPLFLPESANVLSAATFPVAFKLRELTGVLDDTSRIISQSCANSCDVVIHELNTAALAAFDAIHMLSLYTRGLSISLSMYVYSYARYLVSRY